jgi:hypothetical protein
MYRTLDIVVLVLTDKCTKLDIVGLVLTYKCIEL